MGIISRFYNWWGALSERSGQQVAVPAMSLVEDAANIGPDAALQIATVWACVQRRASIIASLPLFAYHVRQDGQKELARNERLYAVLHERPNPRMTAFEFWQAMMLNHDLRGNAYARIDRDPRTGEAVALWPMPADQVQPEVLADGRMVYVYQIDDDVAIIAAENVLHLKGLGNGTIGLSKLEFMRATTTEAKQAQTGATKLFGASGKPTGVLMVDHVLNNEQRKNLRERFAEMASGSASRLYVLEANMKYQQLSLSPEDQQLLATRVFGVEEMCRWFDVPPVLVHHSNVTTWGSGVEQIIAGFHKFTIAPITVSIAQAVKRSVMTPKQRASMTVEHGLDALLRADPAGRASFYSTGLQNGYITRNEVRQLENLPRDTSAMANMLTVQSNLIPIEDLGKVDPPGQGPRQPDATPTKGLADIVSDMATKAIAHATADVIAKHITAQEEAALRRHADMLQVLLGAIGSSHKGPAVDFTDAVINVTRTETIAPPPVHVHVPVQAAPQVDVHLPQAKEAPAPQVNVTVQPAAVDLRVDLAMPLRRTESTVQYNDAGDIVRTTTVEQDA